MSHFSAQRRALWSINGHQWSAIHPGMVQEGATTTQRCCTLRRLEIRYTLQALRSEYVHYEIHCTDNIVLCLHCTSVRAVTVVTTNHHNLTPSTFWNGKCRHLLFLIKTFLLTALPRPLFGFDYNFVCLFCWYYFNLRRPGETLNRKVRPDFSKVTEHFITVVKLNICMKMSS